MGVSVDAGLAKTLLLGLDLAGVIDQDSPGGAR